MTPKNNKARLLYYIKLCVSFQTHQWIQTGVTVRKRPIWVKFDDFFSCVTLQFDVWPWKTIGLLFYANWSFVPNFVAIGEFKLELQLVRKRPIWVKMDDCFSRVTLQFDLWPWKTIGHFFYSTSSFVHHFIAIGKIKLELQSGNPNLGQIGWFLEPCDLAVWRMTLKTIGHLFYSTSSFVHHFVAIGEFKLELQSRNAQSGSNLTIFRAVWPFDLTYDLEKQRAPLLSNIK